MGHRRAAAAHGVLHLPAPLQGREVFQNKLGLSDSTSGVQESPRINPNSTLHRLRPNPETSSQEQALD